MNMNGSNALNGTHPLDIVTFYDVKFAAIERSHLYAEILNGITVYVIITEIIPTAGIFHI